MKKVKQMLNLTVTFIKRNEKIILYFAAALLLVWILSLKTCNKNNPYANQQEIIDSLTLANQTKDIIINKNNQEVHIQQAIVVNNQKLINRLADSVFALKRKNSKNTNTVAYVSEYTQAELEDYMLGFVDTLEFKKFSDSVSKQCTDVISYMNNNTITVPRSIRDSTKNFYFVGKVIQTGVHIDSLSIPDSTYIRFVEHKGGLFKRNTLGKVKFWTKKSIEVQVVHTNPLIKVNKMNSIFFIPKVKQRWLERVLIAGVSAFLTSKLLR